MEQKLCEKCLRSRKEMGYHAGAPWDHCHHEEEKPEEKCWCEYAESFSFDDYRPNRIEVCESAGLKFFDIKFCPACGRKLETK